MRGVRSTVQYTYMCSASWVIKYSRYIAINMRVIGSLLSSK